MKEISENITVRSIVGRFLEHSRIYYFYNNSEEEIYISSADWMYRNLSKRVETMGIVEDEAIKEKIKQILQIYLSDNTNAYELQADGSYIPVGIEKRIVNSQMEMLNLMKDESPKIKICDVLMPIIKYN